MEINEEILKDIDFEKNSLVKCNNLLLTKYEIEILDKYNIDYLKMKSLKEVIFYIESLLNDDSTLEDLEEISKTISERDYYYYTNK